MKKMVFFLTLVLFCFLSCNSENKVNFDAFTTFLNKGLNYRHNLPEEATFLILPLDICETCLTKTKSLLLSIDNPPKNIYIIVSANTANETNYFSDVLSSKYNIIQDSTGVLLKENNFLNKKSQTLLKIKKNKLAHFFYFNQNKNFDLVKVELFKNTNF